MSNAKSNAQFFDAKTRKKMLAIVSRPREARKAAGVNQTTFWTLFGATQSGGSRYETGRAIPGPMQLLMSLYAAGKLTDEDILGAQQALGDVFKASTE
jgi:hypothetical protein